MDVSHRIEVLTKKHKELHARVEAAEAENAPDEYLVTMKKEKLALKDEIEKLNVNVRGIPRKHML
tara:strand:- start:300 stop:494 length:195 start_codon:yes stop_codon:yes gene_type:complete